MQDTFTSKEDLAVKQRIRIDRSPKKNESALLSLLQPLMPNVPLQLWEENKQKKWFSKRLRGRCATKKARSCQKESNQPASSHVNVVDDVFGAASDVYDNND